MKWTGAAVWDAAIVLSLFLADNSHLVKGKRVLEVGAGLALASVAVAMAGASEVIATDYDEIVLSLARKNLEENVRLCNSCCTHTYTQSLSPPPIYICMYIYIYIHMYMFISSQVYANAGSRDGKDRQCNCTASSVGFTECC
jgi:predicted nicotinamide N-methyase